MYICLEEVCYLSAPSTSFYPEKMAELVDFLCLRCNGRPATASGRRKGMKSPRKAWKVPMEAPESILVHRVTGRHRRRPEKLPSFTFDDEPFP